MKVTLLVDREAIVIPASRNTPTIWSSHNLMHPHIAAALEADGHSVEILPFELGAQGTVKRLHNSRPDLVFNLTLHINQKRRDSLQIATILDLLELPYTGAGPGGIIRATDKALSKNIARMLGIRVPQFHAVPCGAKPERGRVPLPAIVKPRFEGGSVGITEKSLVHTHSRLCRRVAWIHRKFQQPAVCEEFIVGREVSVGILGNDQPLVFPIRERLFGGDNPMSQFVTHRIKNDSRHRESRGIHWERASLRQPAVKRITDASVALYRGLLLRDFARIDYRLTSKGELVFLEANHCPDCAPDSFGMFARWQGADYQTLLHSILMLCMERNRRPVRHSREVPTLLHMARNRTTSAEARVG